MRFPQTWISIALCCVTIAVPAPHALAHDYVVEGGDSPGPPDDPDDTDPPPCDKPCSHETPEDGKSPEVAFGGTGVCTSGEPIALHSGAFYYRHTDLTIPGRIPMAIRRAYDTRNAFNGVMGYGWSFNYHMRLFPLDDGNLILKRGDNSKDVFTANGDGTYASPAHLYQTITFNGNGTYTLEKKSGYRYEFDINGHLLEIANRRDNQLLFTYDSAGLLPINGISPFASTPAPILIGFDYRLTRISEAQAGVHTGRYIELTYNANGRVELIEDFTGRQVSYAYDESGNGDLLSVADPMGNTYDYTYDAGHQVLTFVGGGCPDCSLHSNTYDVEGRCIQQTHGNLTIDIDYFELGVHTKVTTWIYDDDSPDPENPELLHTRYEYFDFDEAGRTARFTRQMGDELDEDPESTEDDDIVTAYEYYPTSGAIASMTDPRGVTTTYQYDDRGNLTEELITDPDDPTQWWTRVFEYNDPNGPNQYSAVEVTASFDELSHRTEYTYFPSGRLMDVIQFPNDSTSYTTSYTYYATGDIATRQDPRGHILAYDYDAYGFPHREYDPADPTHHTLYEYNAIGTLARRTDALDRTSSFEYDALGRLTVLTNPLGEQMVNTYDGPNLVEVENGRTATEADRRKRMLYDSLNRRTSVESLNDAGEWVTLVTTSYDSEQGILQQTDGNRNAMRFVRDVLGRTVAVSDALAHTTAFSFDKGGNLVSTIDAEDNETSTDYDFLGRRSFFDYGATYEIRYQHDAMGNVVEIEDDNVHSTYYHRDRMSRLTRLEDANGNSSVFAYDGNGNLVGKITPNEYAGQQRPIVYEYDNYNWLTTVTYPGGADIISFTYDLVGNRTAWDDGVYSEASVIDALDRLKERTSHLQEFSKGVAYAYEPTGEVKSVTDGEGRTTHYHRNALGRLRYIAHRGNLLTEYGYDVAGRQTERTLPNGVVATLQHDDADRLTSLVHTGASGVLASCGYTYDDVSNRETMTTLAGTHSYGYTDIYQLTSATHPEPELADEAYTYDGVQNRLTSSEHSDYDYDDTNFLLSYGPYALTPDAAGNVVTKTGPEGTTAYAYNHDNHLVGVSTPEHAVEFAYAPSGRRIGKTVDGVTTFYLYDGPNVVGEYDATGVLQASFFHGRLIDEPIAMVEGQGLYPTGDLDHNGIVDLDDFAIFHQFAMDPGNDDGLPADLDGDGDGDLRDFAALQAAFGDTGAPDNIQYYLADGLGSITHLTASDGTITEAYVYDAFGQRFGGGPESTNPYLFTARRFDHETGLYYFRTRYRESRLGWFTSIDQIGSWGDMGNYGNGYAYVGNRPSVFTDPFGLKWDWCLKPCKYVCLIGAAGIGIGVCAETVGTGCYAAGIVAAIGCDACFDYCEEVVCQPSVPDPRDSRWGPGGGGGGGGWGGDPTPTPIPMPAPVPLPAPTSWP